MRRARRVQPPLEHRAVQHDRARDRPSVAALLERPRVHEQGAVPELGVRLLRGHPIETRPGLGQQLVDRLRHAPMIPSPGAWYRWGVEGEYPRGVAVNTADRPGAPAHQGGETFD
jgi:hypothetical protein